MINWKIRIQDPMFWMSAIPALLLLIQAILSILGIEWNFLQLEEQLLAIVNAVFGLLTILGVVRDPTTKGLSDSDRALMYNETK